MSTWEREIVCYYTNNTHSTKETENTENKDKWDTTEKEQTMKQAVGGLFLHIPQCITTSRQEVFNY